MAKTKDELLTDLDNFDAKMDAEDAEAASKRGRKKKSEVATETTEATPSE